MRRFFIVFSVAILLFFTLCLAHAEVVKIGAIFALSGKAKASNEPSVQGVRLAMEEIERRYRAKGTGREIEILFFDNESTPIGSHLAAMKAMEHNVSIIIGATWSSHSLAIARLAQENSIPMISPISTIPSLTKIGDFIFRVCYDDNFQGKTIAHFAYKDLPSKTAVIFTDITSDFSLNISETFKNTYTELGGEIAGVLEYKTGLDDLETMIKKAKELHADIAFLSGHDESGLIAKRMSEAGIEAIPVGTDGWSSESFFTRGGNTIREGYYINHWIAENGSERWQWIKESKAESERVLAPTALAFDAVMLAAKAVQESPSLRRRELRDTIHNMKDYDGVTGKINFNQHGDALKGACIVKITNGSASHLKCVPPQSFNLIL